MIRCFSGIDGKERELDINVRACIEAHLEGMSWRKIGGGSTPAKRAARRARFGAGCNMATMEHLRTSGEWKTEVIRYAVEHGHDVGELVKEMVRFRR